MMFGVEKAEKVQSANRSFQPTHEQTLVINSLSQRFAKKFWSSRFITQPAL